MMGLIKDLALPVGYQIYLCNYISVSHSSGVEGKHS